MTLDGENKYLESKVAEMKVHKSISNQQIEQYKVWIVELEAQNSSL